MDSGEQLYDIHLKLGAPVEFGVNMEALAGGQVAPPPEGARFDVPFEGTATGRLAGRVTGIDYLSVRADGRFDLHVHAVMATNDGERVSIFVDGVAVPRPNSPMLDLRENVTLHASSDAYKWVNGVQIWATGTVDLSKQEVHVTGRVA